MVLIFWLPIKPVTANSYYSVSGNHVYITERGRKQKEFIHNFLAQNNIGRIEGRVKLTLYVYHVDNRVYDIDNILKPLIDCLKDKCFGDDSLVYNINVTKGGTEYNRNCVYVQIENF